MSLIWLVSAFTEASISSLRFLLDTAASICLRYDLRQVFHHVLLSVGARVDGYLADAGCTAGDGACASHALERHVAALHDHLTHRSQQVAAVVHVADDDLRCRDHDAVLVAVELASIQAFEYLALHLLYGRLLLMNLFQFFLNALLEVVHHVLPLFKYIILHLFCELIGGYLILVMFFLVLFLNDSHIGFCLYIELWQLFDLPITSRSYFLIALP